MYSAKMIAFLFGVNFNTILVLIYIMIFKCHYHGALGFNLNRVENSTKNVKTSVSKDSNKAIDKMTKLQLTLNETSGALEDLMQKPATIYALKLFEDLLDGKNMAEAAGRSWDKRLVSKSDTIRSYSPKKDKKPSLRRKTYAFHIPPLPAHEVLQQAELRVTLPKSHGTENLKHKLLLTVKKSNSVIRKIRIRRKPLVDGQHHVYDVTSLIRSWINGYHGDVTIKVHIKGPSSNEASISSDNNADEAILVFFSNDSGVTASILKTKVAPEVQSSPLHSQTTHSRRKRSSRRHRKRLLNKTGKRRKCGKLNYEVDFDLIGWGKWIIHPKKFNAKTCKGLCASSVLQEYSPTNHAILMSLMRHRDKKATRPCCVPDKLKPLSMLYYEYNEIVVRHHEGMVVDSCGCK